MGALARAKPYWEARDFRGAARAAVRVARRRLGPPMPPPPTYDDVTFDQLPDSAAVRVLYEVLLDREPDAGGYGVFMDRLASGQCDRTQAIDLIRGSEEFQQRPFGPLSLSSSIHSGRGQFIRSLPAARRIVDLGGTHRAYDSGAMVAMGYPYRFDSLTIIDLPSEDRHELYRADDSRRSVETPLGPVTYRYHSMTDLSAFDDGSVDLVYSGQSIEHVTPEDAALVLKQVVRILAPGGWLGLDTPNGTVTRLQQPEFVDPDHKVEYTWPQLRTLLMGAGLEIHSAAGLNYVPSVAREGRFDMAEAAAHPGLYSALEDCYLLAVVARKPRR